MSTTTQHLGLIQPALSEKHGATTYKANNTIIDNAYGEYLNNYEQSLENVAPIEGDMASNNYSVGQYIIKDGGLYRVTSSIASGESIVVGTNVIATSLNEAVASLNNTVASINNAIGTVNVATNGNLQAQVSALQDSVSPSSLNAVAYTDVYTGVTIHSGTQWQRMGRLVILWVQISVPSVSNSGKTLVRLTNIPAPIKNENYFTGSNAGYHSAFYLGNDKTIRTSGALTLGNWLGGMVVYFTND